MCELLTTREVEREFGIASGTLRYWRHNDQGPASFVLGKRVVYRRSEIERWIAAQEKATMRGGVA
ncbi:helix-turn-helix transcriptional regulator [Antrihabitans spumae]|uniref:Helix-turn-helix transcriptional regulator n=1 Tax=Antrihabitans spumae TaxID=3373370 RepID=A0ABW7KP86_9NOCA